MLKVGQQLNVTELDFDPIKSNLKAYFKRADSPFKDWDFDGSGLNLLLDVLAYNTHYNAVLAHMSINESFLDSAQIRANVVSAGKLLGYTPRSCVAARATINATFQARGDFEEGYDSLTLERGTEFKTVLNGITYLFFLEDSITVPRSASNTFVFTDLVIVQGSLRRARYLCNKTNTRQIFTLDAENNDLSDLRVSVYTSATSAILERYTLFSDFWNIDGTSPIYFLYENHAGKYEISFGDNVFGKRPHIMSVVELEYVRTNSTAVNGAQIFSYAGTAEIAPNVFGLNPVVVATSAASGGSDRETVDSIKFNAPLSFVAQNRAITVDDYSAILRSTFSYIEALSVWGGENNPTPQYGKVYLSIKPTGSAYLTDQQKTDILTLLERKKVLTIGVELVDPEYLYLLFDVVFNYDPTKTTLSVGELRSVVRSAIVKFNSDFLQSFGGVFRFSKLLSAIDNSNLAINNSLARVMIMKEQAFSSTLSTKVTVNFGLQLSGAIDQEESMISHLGAGLLQHGERTFIGDKPIYGSTTLRQLYTYRIDNDIHVTIDSNIGTLDPTLGILDFNAFEIDEDTIVQLSTVAASDDVTPLRNQLLIFDSGKTTISGQAETNSAANKVPSNFFRNA
jgi:hypothetical protein